MTRRAGVAVLAVAGVALAACSDSLVRPPATVDAGFTATVVQYRDQVVTRQVSLTVTNGGDADLHLTSLRLTWPALEVQPADPLDYTVFRGVRVDLAVHVGEAVCTDPPVFDASPPPGPVTAIATTDDPDVPAVAVAVDDVDGVLADLYRRSCNRQAIEHAVRIELGPITDGGADPPTAVAELVLTRAASDDEIEVLDLGGSVVVDTALGGDERVLAPGDDSLRIPIAFTNARCDPHARSETKQPFVFPLQLRLGDREVAYTLQPDQAGRDALTSLVLDRCPDLTGI